MGDAELAYAMPDICAGYQSAVIDQLVGKTKHLIQAGSYSSLGLSGGVSNNKALRLEIERLARRHHMECLIAKPQHTGDNAAMIAFAAYADTEGLACDDFSIEPSLRLACE
jgi:N6-L-threonylcarbamoyladenine synthase